LHDFEVLLVLCGGAGGYFVEPLASDGFFEWAPAGEGGEELVVAAPAAKGDVATHGEGVDEFVVKGLIVERVGSGDVSLRANGLRWDAPGESDICDELERCLIDAEILLCGFGEEGFGVDGAGEVHVEIGSLGEGLEEGVELGCAGLFGGVEGALGAGSGGGERRLRGERGGKKDRGGECDKGLANGDHAACLSAWLWVMKFVQG